MSRETPRWVLVARILRARGNKGEVAAEILTDFPERLTGLREVFAGPADGKNEPRRFSLRLRLCWGPCAMCSFPAKESPGHRSSKWKLRSEKS
ncbi:MAG: hypothetical protein DMG54_02115 [Acidobacteria bacterium]|nr:MAG: hypothetical protein DMG54_02115 [Acidobacteriota bacterium]